MAEIEILLPGVLTRGTGPKRVKAQASTLGELVEVLARDKEAELSRLLDDQGKLRRLLNVYVNGKNVRLTGSLETVLKDGDEVSILPTVAGG